VLGNFGTGAADCPLGTAAADPSGIHFQKGKREKAKGKRQKGKGKGKREKAKT
jgi:hypothetical protein